jgi:hypothetical protein
MDTSAPVASNLQLDVHSVQTNPCKANISAQPLQKESIPSQPTGPMVLMNMSFLLKRNMLVDIKHDDLTACTMMIDSCCNEDRKAARKKYDQLRFKCAKQDATIDRSYRLYPGTAEEWQKFGQDCMCMMVLHQSLFLQDVRLAPLELPSEEAVQQKAAELRSQGW